MLSARFSVLADTRQEAKRDYPMHDVFMSAFAMMFFQDPSLLQFQQRLEDEAHMNNLRTLFHVTSIPKDTQMREVMDDVDPEQITPLFDDFFRPLQRGKRLEQYRVLDGRYIVALDGSQYFSSEKISCPGCLIKEGKKGAARYSHQIVQAALMNPDMRQVIPLAPEEVKNTDGKEKQDCEINAGKRLLGKIRRSHPKLPLVVVADSLYSKQPAIEEMSRLHMNYVLVAKPEDHKKLTEWVNEMRMLKETTRLTVKGGGRTRIYEWINGVPLNDNKRTVMVNYFECWIQKDGETTYHNSWVTDLVVAENNIEQLVKGGRCRWKIENETFNTLKNQGYHLEHNYGHGKKHLSFNFFLLNLLAFFMHQIFELTYIPYQQLRQKFGSKRNLWDHLRASLYLIIFADIDNYFERMLDPRKFT
jgi:DDE_Tnp_1-associated/Transposase DDE domain